MQEPESQLCVELQMEQLVPPVPQPLLVVPDTHCPAAQHPVQDVPSHTQLPATQCRPLPQEPLAHVPPQPSLSPQALPVQLGTQTQLPPVQFQPLGQTAQPRPPVPQAFVLFPIWHAPPLQQPLAHDVESHWHEPATHRSPAGQLPSEQMPLQPSL